MNALQDIYFTSSPFPTHGDYMPTYPCTHGMEETQSVVGTTVGMKKKLGNITHATNTNTNKIMNDRTSIPASHVFHSTKRMQSSSYDTVTSGVKTQRTSSSGK